MSAASGKLTAALLEAYPFSPDSDSGLVLPDDVRSLFADACVRVASAPEGGRLRLSSFIFSGGAYTPANFSFELAWDGGDTVLDTAAPGVSTTVTTWGAWVLVTARYGSVVAVFTLHGASIDGIGFSLPVGGFPLAAGCVDVRSRGVTRIRVQNQGVAPTGWLGGDVVLAEGYNLALLNRAPAFEDPATGSSFIELEVGAGAGAGASTSCDDATLPVLRDLGGATGDRYGFVRLASMTGCYRIGQASNRVPSRIQLHNDCGVCCSCSDYVTVYNMFAASAKQLNDTADRIRALLETVSALRERWLALQESRTEFELRLDAQAKPGWFISVSAYFMNSSGADVSQVSITTRISPAVPETVKFSVVKKSVMLYTPRSGWSAAGNKASDYGSADTEGPMIDLQEPLKPGETAGIQFELYVANLDNLQPCRGDPRFGVVVAAVASVGGTSVAERTVSLVPVPPRFYNEEQQADP